MRRNFELMLIANTTLIHNQHQNSVYEDLESWNADKASQKILIHRTGAIEPMKITVPFSKTLIINNPEPKME
jgi:hypothetical protein